MSIQLAFMLGNLLIGTGVMLVYGMLNLMAADLAISVPMAGTLVGVPAAVICISAPLLATLTSRWDRRALLAGAIAFFGLMHMACALAPNHPWLLVLRALTVVSAGIFTPQAAVTLGLVLPAEKRAGAITFIFLGWSVASVAAMPAAAWIGAHVGWRGTFAGFGLLCFFGSYAVWRAVPAGLRGVHLSWGAWRQVAEHPALMGILAVTALSGTGQFTTWAYIAPFTHAMLGPSPELFSALLAWLGACGLIGNVLASRNASRPVGRSWAGAHWNVHLGCTSMALGLLLMALFAGNLWGFLLAATFWGGGVFASNSSQQARLGAASPELAGASIALNTSMIYLGQAAGSLIGGSVIAQWGFGVLPVFGAVLVSAAIAMSFRATRLVRAARMRAAQNPN